MTRKYANIPLETRMKNNSNKNQQFESACREARLSEEEKNKFRDALHRDKEFETGDYEYSDLVEMAKTFKR